MRIHSPWSLLLLPLLLLLVWMGLAVSGPGTPERYRYVRDVGVPAVYVVAREYQSSPEQGRALFERHCVICHGMTGAGDGASGQRLHPRPADLRRLSGSATTQAEAYLRWSIAEGGSRFGTGMPAFADTLTAEQIEALIAYLETLSYSTR